MSSSDSAMFTALEERVTRLEERVQELTEGKLLPQEPVPDHTEDREFRRGPGRPPGPRP